MKITNIRKTFFGILLKSFTILTFLLHSQLAYSQFEGTKDSGGGTPEEVKFKTWGREIYNAFMENVSNTNPDWQLTALGNKQDLELFGVQLLSAINKTIPECATGPMLTHINSLHKMAWYDGHKISLDCNQLQKIDVPQSKTYQFVFHEYLRVMGRESHEYKISSRVYFEIDENINPASIQTRETGISPRKLKMKFNLALTNTPLSHRFGILSQKPTIKMLCSYHSVSANFQMIKETVLLKDGERRVVRCGPDDFETLEFSRTESKISVALALRNRNKPNMKQTHSIANIFSESNTFNEKISVTYGDYLISNVIHCTLDDEDFK